MNNFNIIYKILKALEYSMDYDEFDTEAVSAERLKISERRLIEIWAMLVHEGYVSGVSVKYGAQGDIVVSAGRPRITLRGLEYLSENSLMNRAMNLAKGILVGT